MIDKLLDFVRMRSKMQTQVLNYRIIVSPDKQTGTGKPGFVAQCPTLGIADDGDTVEEALANVKQAIQVFVDSLVEDKEPVPVDLTEQDIVTTTQVSASGQFQFA
jgi:predicted RNase H-like HicB family nuclease